MINQLIIGMPNSGKSTFIAALRHLLVAEEVETELKLTGLATNEEHQNRLESEWLACNEVERTKPATEGWMEFHVRDDKSGIESTISMPDLRGEVFEQPSCIGQCRKELFDAIANTDGVLFFTNADRGDDNLLISDVADILGEAERTEYQEQIQNFKPEDMPEEVKVVEFLQFTNRRPRLSRKRKIVVLISAWDVIEDSSDIHPEAWIKSNRPMLSQFLSSNEHLWELRIYGISAQGGRLPQKKDELEKIASPSKRIRVIGHDANIHDLSAPLRWLMSSDY